jgi:endonuclease/exonuclease/phosphatase family metal-dependent hydrolase
MLTRLLTILLIILTPAAHAATDLSVMSFNIRYGTADDGENHWNHRRDMVAEVFRTRHADIVGVQEALNFQITEITTANPAYAVLGVGRDDGRSKGEFSAILYRADRFAVAESGTFWLSDTPETVASATWGNRITRICTWARLIDRASGDAFYIFNTHFDHESQPSRERSARLIAERIAARASPDPVILMGDFNAGETNPAITFFTQSPPGPRPPGHLPRHPPRRNHDRHLQRLPRQHRRRTHRRHPRHTGHHHPRRRHRPHQHRRPFPLRPLPRLGHPHPARARRLMDAMHHTTHCHPDLPDNLLP